MTQSVAILLNGTLTTGQSTSWLAVTIVAMGLLGLLSGVAMRARRRRA